MSLLFQPLSIGPLTLANRIVVAPMCQYSASDDGSATDWHLMHLGQLALSGAAMMVLEATAVEAVGRISPADLGLYSDANEEALARVLAAVRRHAPIRLALQLAHAGRKASSRAPWHGGMQIPSTDADGWLAVAPSARPHSPDDEPPAALDAAGLARVRAAFAATARRAVRRGFDGLEVHAAHGYQLHPVLSPRANHRVDAYGGPLENRMRFPLEVFDAVRAAAPASTPVWVRVSATDWVDGGWTVDDTITFVHALRERGCAAVHVSSGGVSPAQKIPLGPGYQLPLARALKSAVGLPTIGVGLITEPAQAEAALAAGDADAVALARAMLYDPRWPWHAAAALGAQVVAPPQYWRSQPRAHKDLFAAAAFGQR
jgi:2,4-dienoyl-CoA reductase-like NADH-dependent reductase (Old Yellow Enzyme family)